MLPLLIVVLLAQLGDEPRRLGNGTTHSAPLITSGHLPICGAADCLMRFTVATDGGCEAVAGSGRSYTADMNQGTSPTFAETAFVPSPGGVGRYARTGITDSSACYLPAAAAADAGLNTALTGDHTVTCAYWTKDTDAITPFGYGVANADGLFFQNYTATSRVYWSSADAGIGSENTAVGARGNWVVHSAVKSGTSFTSRVNGTAQTSTLDLALVAPTTRNLYLGRYNNAGASMGGAEAWCGMWNRALSSSELSGIEAQWWGTKTSSGYVSTARASTAWLPQVDGGVTAYGNAAARIDSRGLLSYAGESNAVPGAFSAWTADKANLSDGGTVAAPTVGAVGSCPYPDPTGGSGAVKVDFPAIDESASGAPTGFSRIRAAFTGTAVPWTGSVFVRAANDTDGGALYGSFASGSVAMDAGSSWMRAPWTTTLTAESRNAQFGPTTVAAYSQPLTQPSLSVCLWAPEAALGSVAGPPAVCGAAPCATLGDVHTELSAGKPTTSGRVAVVYRPWATSASVRCLLDTIASNNGLRICTAADNTLVLTLGNGSATATTTSGAQTWTGGTDYRIEVEWGDGNAFVRKDGALIATTTDKSQKIPTAHAANYAIGNVIAGTSPANGWVSKPTWGRR